VARRGARVTKKLWNVVLNWNGAADTVALLGTLARCRMPEGWEMHTLVVDNASTDGSVEKIGAAFPAAEILRHDSNRRFAGGNHPGIERALAAGADAVMLLNNDTEADPALIERLLLALEQHPEGGAASPLIYFGPERSRIYAGLLMLLVGLLSLMMVSTLRFSSFKTVGTSTRNMRPIILALALLVLVFLYSRYVLLAIVVMYIMHGLLSRVAGVFWRRGDSAETKIEANPVRRS
jgi:hypothetical protein